MLIDNLLLYEKNFGTEIGQPQHDMYLLFDYDDRSAAINMEFQHFHRFFEIHLLVDREANHIIEGNLFHIRPFDIVLLPPGKLHKSEYPEGPAVKRLIINFQLPKSENPVLTGEQERILSTFYSALPIYRFEQKTKEELISHINTIFRIMKSDSEVRLTRLHAEFLQFLSCLYVNREKNIYNQTTDDNIANKIYRITSYIHSHYTENLSLESLAGEFYISTYYLSHQFKEVTGFTITNYIQMTRIRNAQQKLLGTEKKITDIAEECGFNSFSQFNRVFNKVCGISPSKFRSDSKTK